MSFLLTLVKFSMDPRVALHGQMALGINLTKWGKRLCKFINSILTGFERVESVFFKFFKLDVALIHEFKSALDHRSGSLSISVALLSIVIPYRAGVQTHLACASCTTYDCLCAQHSIVSPLTFQPL